MECEEMIKQANKDYFESQYEEMRATVNEWVYDVGVGGSGHISDSDPLFTPHELYKPKPASSPKEAISKCNHKYVQYQGLVEAFEYCALCDERRV